MGQLKRCNVIAVKKRDAPHNWNTAMGGYEISGERLGRRGSGVVFS